MATLSFPGFSIELAPSTVQVEGADGSDDRLPNGATSYLIRAPEVRLALPRPASSWYHHGWQSWSLASWHEVGVGLPVQHPAILHPLQIDPAHARTEEPNGSWVGAVRFEDDSVLLLGALGTDARVNLKDDTIRGVYDGSAQDPTWMVVHGEVDHAFSSYAVALSDSLGRAPEKPAPQVWCSWYSLYTGITEETITAVVRGVGESVFDTIQIDDGWQLEIGDWEPNPKFPSGMAAVADTIRATGRRAGLWLAPLIATARSRLVHDHREWFLRDDDGRLVSAGFNWGDQLYALDTTNPSVLSWLEHLMQTVRSWGFDYLKLDFLYGGALPGKRAVPTPREEAYRQGLQTMRQAMGDAYFVACGAPIVPSLGLCDALRIGPDVAGFWESRRDERYLTNPTIPGTRNAIRTSVNRLWLAPAVKLDPDVVYLFPEGNSLTDGQREMLQSLATICDFIATSDLPADGLEERIQALSESAAVRKIGPYLYEIGESEIDFSPALGLPRENHGINKLLAGIVSWVGDSRLALRIMDALGRRSAARRTRRFLKTAAGAG